MSQPSPATTRRRRTILALRAEGLTDAEIGRRLNLDSSAVWKLRHPEETRELRRRDNKRRSQAKREWERDPANRCPCVVCGRPTGRTPRRSVVRPQCRKCRRAERRAARERLDREALRLHTAGVSLPDIADTIGAASPAAVRTRLWKLQRESAESEGSVGS